MDNLGDVLKMQNGRKSIVYVPSSQKRNDGLIISSQLIVNYESRIGSDFDELMDLNQSIYRLEMDHVKWEYSNCSCPQFCRKRVCKHMLGMAFKLKLVKPPPNANPAKLAQPRKTVPNARAKPALQMQPFFDNAASAQLLQLLPSSPEAQRSTSPQEIPQINTGSKRTEPLASELPESRPLLPEKTTRAMTTRSKRPAPDQSASDLPAQKKQKCFEVPSQCSGKLIAFGGLHSCNSVSSQSFMDGKWSLLPTCKGAQAIRAANSSYAHHDGEILISGGMGSAALKRTTLLKLRLNKIQKMPAMKSARCAHASAYFADTYFVAGGKTSKETLDTVEK